MEYLDFELEIGGPVGDGYPVAVRSSAGETRAHVQLPTLDGALRRSVAAGRDVVADGDEAAGAASTSLQAFGRTLFAAVFVGQIRSLFATMRERALSSGRGVRIRLRLLTPHSAMLPWELMYDGGQDEYLALSRQTVLCRYLELARSIRTLGVKPPLRVLVMISTPSGVPALDGAGERQRIERATAQLTATGSVAIDWLEGASATYDTLQQRMQGPEPWHVFHYVGHGTFDASAGQGELALTDGLGAVSWISGETLGLLFRDHAPLQLAVLNCCRSAESDDVSLFASTAARVAASGVPAVVAMQQVVGDASAIAFAGQLYGAIANGLPADAAVSEGRKAMKAIDKTDFGWALPVIYLRSPDGKLFAIEAPAARPAPSPIAWYRRPIAALAGIGALAIAVLAVKYRWFGETVPPRADTIVAPRAIDASPATDAPRAIGAPICGNGIIDFGEQCDGAPVGGLACDHLCRLVPRTEGARPPDRSGKRTGSHAVEAGDLKAGDRSHVKVGNVTGRGNPDVGVQSVTTGSDSTIEIGNKQP